MRTLAKELGFFFNFRSMRTSINLLFLNLCLADLFALVITGPTVVVDMFAKEAWYLGSFMCEYRECCRFHGFIVHL